jgi:hypothetical protein
MLHKQNPPTRRLRLLKVTTLKKASAYSRRDILYFTKVRCSRQEPDNSANAYKVAALVMGIDPLYFSASYYSIHPANLE